MWFKNFKSYFILNNKNIIENVNLNNIINSKFLTKNGYFRIVYDLNTGICLCEAIDIRVNPDILYPPAAAQNKLKYH